MLLLISVSLQPPPSAGTAPTATVAQPLCVTRHTTCDRLLPSAYRRPYVRPAIDSAKEVCGVVSRSITPAPSPLPTRNPALCLPQTNNPDPILALLNYSLVCADAKPPVCWWRRPRRCRWVCCWCHSLDRALLLTNDSPPPPTFKKPQTLYREL